MSEGRLMAVVPCWTIAPGLDQPEILRGIRLTEDAAAIRVGRRLVRAPAGEVEMWPLPLLVGINAQVDAAVCALVRSYRLEPQPHVVADGGLFSGATLVLLQPGPYQLRRWLDGQRWLLHVAERPVAVRHGGLTEGRWS